MLNVDSLRLLLTVALAVAVLVEGARHLSDPFARWFGSHAGELLRRHEHAGLTGATWLFASMLAALVLLPPAPAIVALWAAAVGDGSASVIGRWMSHMRGRTGGGKTMAGTLACLVATAIGAAWLGEARIGVALGIGAITAAAEWPRGPLDDNVRVTMVAGLAAWVLGVA